MGIHYASWRPPGRFLDYCRFLFRLVQSTGAAINIQPLKNISSGTFWKKSLFVKDALHMQRMLHMQSTCVAYATYVAYAKYRCCICDICCICEAHVLCLQRLLHMWSGWWALWWWGGRQGLCKGAAGYSGVRIWISILQVFFFEFPLPTHQTTPHFFVHWMILNSCRWSTIEMTLL